MEEKEEKEMNNIKKIENIVREACKKSEREYQFKYHILIVRKYAILLAKKYKANRKVVELVALLHDIGRLKFGYRKHAISGAMEAERILRKLNYNQNTINQVKDCILSHRHSSKRKTISLEAKISKDADALAHFEAIPVLFTAALSKNFYRKIPEEDAWKWVHNKIKRDWETLQFPLSRKIAKKKYYAALTLLQGVVK
jgi:uncharacterized protein